MNNSLANSLVHAVIKSIPNRYGGMNVDMCARAKAGTHTFLRACDFREEDELRVRVERLVVTDY